MGSCMSSHHKDRKKKQGSRMESFRTIFKGLSPEESGREESNQNVRPSSSSGRRTLANILKDEKQEVPVHHHQSQDSKEETWFDAEGRFVSDSEDEFMSVCGDGNSLNVPSTPATPKTTFGTLKDQMMKADSAGSPVANGHIAADEIPSTIVHEEDDKRNVATQGSVSLGKRLEATTPRNSSVSVAPISDGSSEYEASKHGGQHASHHGKSEFEGCLPCLLNSVASNDKRSPQRRKSFRLFPSFRRRSSADIADILDLQDMSRVLHRPFAGSQVPASDGSGEGTWSKIIASTFKLRSRNYLKDKKKQQASNMSIYEAVGVDVFLSSRKVDHIARFVDYSHFVDKDADDKFPPLFIFNIQVPMYTASVFPSESNGEGVSLVFYYKLSESFKKDGPPYLKDMLARVLDDEQEKIRGLVGESTVPFRERMKIVARVLNPEEIHLSAPERKLVVTYNEKPVLSRPQHSFYKGPGYFEMDLDVHRFNFIARKAVESFRERLKLCVLDIGLTIQGNKPDELPEHILCCARINRLNLANFKYLNCEDEPLTPRK